MSVLKARKKAWGAMSRYIRIKYSDSNGYCSCVTCGLTKHYKEMQAGHFIPQAQGNAVRFCEENVHPQCYRCNINLGGNIVEYYEYMREMYGEEKILELRQLSKTTVKYTVKDLQEIEAYYRQALTDLVEHRGY